jgi:hypothetical protein
VTSFLSKSATFGLSRLQIGVRELVERHHAIIQKVQKW